MLTRDPIHELAHAHADLNRRVLEIGALVRTVERGHARALVGPLGELREILFLHFAREEGGCLFPFVAETVRELADQVDEMAIAHDTICGALARMFHLTSFDADPASPTC
jgi:iron-sulfur cluster repair protein YtfE (RIC family)